MSKRILTISNQPFVQATIENVCAQSGIETAVATTSGNETLEMYRRLKPDLVLIDFSTLEQSYSLLLHAILAIDPCAKVLICATWGQKPLLIEAALCGAKEFLFQPLNPAQVQQALLRYA